MKMKISIPVVALASGVLAVTLGVSSAFAQYGEQPAATQSASTAVPILKEVGVDQKLGAQVPANLQFFDETGRQVHIGDYFKTRPVVLALVYYACPMLCTQVLNGLVEAMQPLSFEPGKDFEVVVVSFNPGDTPGSAAQKKKEEVDRYGRPAGAAGIHFLTGIDANIKALTDSVGFRYKYDEELNQFAHPALVTILTPGGKVSRYLFGIDYGERDLRLALVDATGGRIGSITDQALLFCYHYDPSTGRYNLVAMTLIRTAGLLTLAGLGGFIFFSLRRERRQSAAAGATRPTTTGVR